MGLLTLTGPPAAARRGDRGVRLPDARGRDGLLLPARLPPGALGVRGHTVSARHPGRGHPPGEQAVLAPELLTLKGRHNAFADINLRQLTSAVLDCCLPRVFAHPRRVFVRRESATELTVLLGEGLLDQEGGSVKAAQYHYRWRIVALVKVKASTVSFQKH